MKPFAWARVGGIGSILVFLVLSLSLFGIGLTREVAVGRVEGKLILDSSGGPFTKGDVSLVPAVPTRPGEEAVIRTIRATADAQGTFRLSAVPEGIYFVESYGEAHAAQRTTVQVREGKTSTVDVHLKPNIAGLDLYVNQHTFAPDERPEVYVHGLVTDVNVSVRVYPFTIQEAVAQGSISDLISPVSRSLQSGTPAAAELEARIQKYDVAIGDRDNEGVFHESVDLPPLPEGIYLLAVTANRETHTNYLIVTRNALVVKSDGNRHLAFVADMRSGKPVAGAEISAVQNNASRVVAKTGADGTAEFVLPLTTADGEDSESGSSRATIIASSGDSRAIASVYNRGSGPRLRAFTKTDRPIYRPGDRVHYQTTLRKFGPDGMQLPETQSVQVEVRDPNDQLVASQRLSVNARGSYVGEFPTSADVVGAYRIEAKAANFSDTYWVPVASYRKPEFRMVVRPQQERTFAGDPVRAKVACSYYFGGPVVGASLNAQVYRRPRWMSEEEIEFEEGGESGDSWPGDYVGEVAGVTDGLGEAVLSFDPDSIEPDSPQPGTRRRPEGGDYVYTFQVSATEAGDKYFEGRGQVDVFAGDMSLKIDTDRWFMAPKESAQVSFEVIDPVTGKPVANHQISVTVGYERWRDRNVSFEPISTTKVTTDAAGKATLPVTADRPGWLRIEASLSDSAGRVVRAETGLDVWSGASEQTPDTPGISIALDRNRVAPGESVRALLRSNRPGGSALVTVEHEGIASRKVVPVAEGGSAVELVIPREALPNATVSVVYVSDKQVFESSQMISVPRDSRQIQVKVASDHAEYRPGDMVDLTIRTLDAAGKPVSAEASVAVVDEAVFAIMEDRDSPLRTLYPYQYSNVITSHSLVTLYLDGGSKEGKPADRLRQRFVDTAFWAPQVMTDARGEAKLSFRLPDNLTSFRTTATAITSDTKCGVAKSSFIVAKELMARISPPPHLVVGDEVRLTVGLNSRLASPTPVKVRLESQGVDVVGESSQSVTVSRDKAAQIPFVLRVTTPGPARLRVFAEGGGFQDSMEMPIDVADRARLETDAESTALVSGDVVHSLPGAAKGDRGELVLTASASLAEPLLQGLDRLIDYPYGCVEQTMSRFVPAVIVRQVVADLGLPKPARLDLVPEIAEKSLRRLKSMQNPSGGWGWWQHGDPESEMTAIVLEGLERARGAGIQIDSQMLDSGLNWATNRLKQGLKDRTVSADDWRLAYAVARLRVVPEIAQVLRTPVKEADKLDELHAILGWIELGQRGDGDAMAEARRRWTDLQNRPPKKEADADSYRFTEVHARSLEILLALGGTEEDIDREVDALVEARRGDLWVSTRDTATALAVVAQRLRAQRNAAPTGTISVELAGKVVGQLTVDPSNFLREKLEVRVPLPESERLDLRWRSTGTARFYIASMARSWRHFETAAAKPNPSLRVDRTFHTLGAERQSDGTLALVPSKNAVKRFASGQPMLCRVTLANSGPLSRILVVVPIPGNCRVAEDEEPEYWGWWFSGLQVFDDRVAFFIDRLDAGSRTIEFHVRAETPGSAIAMPASAEPMYVARKQASSDSQMIEVTP